jgi:prepilin-type N-terminal cleavage/methylation domain-containing protein/prepilin-type processing-associated H-X9-DG protein
MNTARDYLASKSSRVPTRRSQAGCHTEGVVKRTRDAGFTLLELLVAIAIISLLIALILPAVQQAREAARTTECKNRLKQIGVAMMLHEESFGRLPGNGWGYLWLGDPDRGTDQQQPGGWIYNLLPYIEQQSLRDRGRGEQAIVQRVTLSKRSQLSLPLFRCPSRPSRPLSPCHPILATVNADWVPMVAKSDYAVNEGDYITNTPAGPASLVAGDDPNYAWTDVSQATGVCFLRSEIRLAAIRDGTSQTYLVGEKYVSQPNYDSDGDPGHDGSMYSGVDLDINRWTLTVPLPDGDNIEARRFGSPHASGCQFLFCDGSVRLVSYGIDADIHRRLGNRHDGKSVSDF